MEVNASLGLSYPDLKFYTTKLYKHRDAYSIAFYHFHNYIYFCLKNNK